MSCPQSKRGHRWGGRATVMAARPTTTADTKFVATHERECLACGAPGVITTQGRTIEVKP